MKLYSIKRRIVFRRDHVFQFLVADRAMKDTSVKEYLTPGLYITPYAEQYGNGCIKARF